MTPCAGIESGILTVKTRTLHDELLCDSVVQYAIRGPDESRLTGVSGNLFGKLRVSSGFGRFFLQVVQTGCRRPTPISGTAPRARARVRDTAVTRPQCLLQLLSATRKVGLSSLTVCIQKVRVRVYDGTSFEVRDARGCSFRRTSWSRSIHLPYRDQQQGLRRRRYPLVLIPRRS